MGLTVVFNIITGFAMLLFFIRFMAQFAGLDKSNPYAEPAFRLTAVVDIFDRIFKPLSDKRISISAIFLMFLIRSIDIAGNLALEKLGYTPLQLLYVSTTSLILDFLNMASWLIIAAAISSLIVLITEKMHPLVEILMQMSDPITAPFRKISPNLGMLDLSPMIALLAIILMEIVIDTITRNMLPMLIIDRETLIFTARLIGLI